MKYLKTYKIITEGTEDYRFVVLPVDIIQEIKEICLELQDVGFTILITEGNYIDGTFVFTYHTVLDIYRKPSFTYREISEVVERIQDYLSDKGYNIISYYKGGENAIERDELKALRKFRDIVPGAHSQIGDTLFRYLFTKNNQNSVK